MHAFLDNVHQGGKYSAEIASHQAELRREENFNNKKLLNISYLQTDYLNLDSSSVFGRNSEIAHDIETKCTLCGGTNHSAENCFKRIRREKKKLVWLILWKIDKRNGQLENVLYVDLKIN